MRLRNVTARVIVHLCEVSPQGTSQYPARVMAGTGFRPEDSLGVIDLPLGMNFLMTVGAKRDQI